MLAQVTFILSLERLLMPSHIFVRCLNRDKQCRVKETGKNKTIKLVQVMILNNVLVYRLNKVFPRTNRKEYAVCLRIANSLVNENNTCYISIKPTQ